MFYKINSEYDCKGFDKILFIKMLMGSFYRNISA